MVDRETYDNYILQKDIQQSNQDKDFMKYAPQLQEQIKENQAILVEQVNPKKIVQDVVLALLNLEEIGYNKYRKLGEPLMNDVGINAMRFILRGVVNQSTTLSHLDSKQVSKIMMRLSDDITDDIAYNRLRYGIDDKMMLDHIVNIVSLACFMVLQRALEQNEKNWLGKISVESINNAARIPSPKKEGFLDKLRL